MELEYDLSKMKRRPNPFANPLKKQVTISLGIDIIEYFDKDGSRRRFILSRTH